MSAALTKQPSPTMDPEISEDLALASCVADGDEAALTVLYERHAEPLFAFVCHHLDGARPEAEEVWQDTLAAALRALPGYHGQSRLFTWLCAIARHKLADHWRGQNRTARRLVLLPPEELARLMDEAPLPEELLTQRGTCLRVVELLGLLPHDYRTALVARYADGHSVKEVARILGKSYKAAESVLSRAKEAFRAVLASQTEVES